MTCLDCKYIGFKNGVFSCVNKYAKGMYGRPVVEMSCCIDWERRKNDEEKDNDETV